MADKPHLEESLLKIMMLAWLIRPRQLIICRVPKYSMEITVVDINLLENTKDCRTMDGHTIPT